MNLKVKKDMYYMVYCILSVVDTPAVYVTIKRLHLFSAHATEMAHLITNLPKCVIKGVKIRGNTG